MTNLAQRTTALRRDVWFCREVLRHGLLDGLRGLADRYGSADLDMIPFSLFGRKAYLATHPEHIGAVLNDTESFKRADVFLKNLEAMLGFTAVTVPADQWLAVRQRTLKFLSGKMLDSYHETMVRILEEDTVPRWRRLSSEGDSIDVFDSMLEYASKVVFAAFLGIPAADVPAHLHRALSEMFDLVRQRVFSFLRSPLWMPTAANRRFRELRGQVYTFLEANLERCAGNGSMIDHLIAEHTQDGKLDRKLLYEEMLGNLIGGSETTIILLIWTLHYLAYEPELQERLYQELSEEGASAKAARTSLLHHCLLESLRIRSPSYLAAREAMRPVRVGSYDLPAGSHILASQFITHNDPRLWEEPERFNPDRFAGAPPRSARDYTNFFPFGGGRNICSGQAYAYQEAAIAVRGLLRHFRILPASPPDVGIAADLTLRPGIPVRIRVASRTAAQPAAGATVGCPYHAATPTPGAAACPQPSAAQGAA